MTRQPQRATAAEGWAHDDSQWRDSKPMPSRQERSYKNHFSLFMQSPTIEHGATALQTGDWRACYSDHALLTGMDILTGTRMFVPGVSQAGDPLTCPSLAHQLTDVRAAGQRGGWEGLLRIAPGPCLPLCRDPSSPTMRLCRSPWLRPPL